MCLIAKKSDSVKKAKRPQVVYKVGNVSFCGTGFNSPWRNFNYEIGEKYKTVLTSDLDGKPIRSGKLNSIARSQIGGGFHCFRKLSEAQAMIDNGYTFVVFKCRIPKGTKYINGKFRYLGNTYSCVVSERLEIVSVVGQRTV